ncbi:MAG: DUF2312 domain-containing protein [Caedimonas sp.]|nr:DUF2312 domain-containing protein [Caedimonas sp.]
MTPFEGISGKQSSQEIDKIKALKKEKQETFDTIKEAYAEAKGFDFNKAIIKKNIKNLGMDKEKIAEHEELISLPMNTLNKTNETYV